MVFEKVNPSLGLFGNLTKIQFIYKIVFYHEKSWNMAVFLKFKKKKKTIFHQSIFHGWNKTCISFDTKCNYIHILLVSILYPNDCQNKIECWDVSQENISIMSNADGQYKSRILSLIIFNYYVWGDFHQKDWIMKSVVCSTNCGIQRRYAPSILDLLGCSDIQWVACAQLI